jgi:LysM repeat protein
MGQRRTRSSASPVVAGIGAIGVLTAVGVGATVAPAAAAGGPEPHGDAPRSPLTGAAPMKTGSEQRTYTVRPGDTVSGIAARFGTTVSAIAAANHLNSRALIMIGQELVIPGGGGGSTSSGGSAGSTSGSGSSSGGSRYTVRSGDTLSGIAAEHDLTVATIMRVNQLSSTVIHPGQQLRVAGGGSSSSSNASSSSPDASSSSGRYTVRGGDTVSAIAARYDTTVGAIIEANDLDSRALIRIGQVLTVPGAGKSSPSSSNGSSSSSAGSSSAATGSSRYTVRSGDTLSGIAAKHDTTVSRISSLNDLDSSVIYPGQKLRLPTTQQLVPSTFLHYTYPADVVAAANENKAELLSTELPGRTRMQEIIRTTATQMGVDPALALAVAHQESGFDAAAVSPANAVGAMQVIPSSGEWASGMVGEDLDLLDPRDNAVAGIAILRYLTRSAPDLPTAIAGYYQGLASVTNNGMYADTRRYVANIQTLMSRYS